MGMLTYLDSQRRKVIIQIRSDWRSLALVLFNITNIIHMANSVSRRLHILYTVFTVYSAMSECSLSIRLWVSVGILLTCGIYLQDFTVTSKQQAYESSLTQARNVNGHTCMCKGYIFIPFLWFFYWILELFRKCGNFCFSFYWCYCYSFNFY